MQKNTLLKTVFVSMIGNLFEFYDFALFGYFAPIIGQLFFPSHDPAVQLISAFGVFAVGFMIRPIGGMIFGHIGDSFGRKRALIIAILLMALPTAVIGILPTYDQIGVWAPILLILMRLLQGLSLGGNYSGSITFISEHTDPKKRGLMGGFAVSSCLFGILLGSATAAFFSNIFTHEDLYHYGWRIPFLLGVVICFVGFYMRRHIHESPEFMEEKHKNEVPKAPLKLVFLEHKKQLGLAVFCTMLHDLSFYLLFVYMTTYFTTILGLSEKMSYAINTANLVIVIAITMTSAWLSDKWGRRKVLSLSAFFFIIATIPLMVLFKNESDLHIFFAQFALAFAVGGYFGPIPAMLVEAFPTNIRFSAVALTTNISGPLFGGTAPMLVTWLITQTGDNLVPAYYLTAAAVISFICVQFIRKNDAPQLRA